MPHFYPLTTPSQNNYDFFFILSDRKYYQTKCEGYEAKISDCKPKETTWEPKTDGDHCSNGGHAYVQCKRIPEPIELT